MSHLEVIGGDSVLNRFKVVPDLGIPFISVRSVQALAWYIILRQEGRRELARLLSRDNVLLRNTASIQTWVQDHGYALTQKWRFNVHKIFKDILIHESFRDGSTIRAEFLRIQAEAQNRSVQFVVPSGRDEMIWTCGLRKKEIPNADTLPGFNCYGNVLRAVYEQFTANTPQPYFGLETLISASPKISFPISYGKKTLLLLSDSQCKFVQNIEGGDVCSVSGGTYEDIGNAIPYCHLGVRDYSYIVINCGINVVRFSEDRRKKSWESLLGKLSSLSEDERKRVLISTAVPHPTDVQGIANNGAWVKQMAKDAGFKCLNWSTRPDSKFMINGELNPDMFENIDEFHLSHNGFQEMWKGWAGYFPDLRYLPYTMGPNPGPGYIRDKWVLRDYAARYL